MVSNKDRELIIVYYLQDDTLRIFELALPNSGFPGGNFLRRQKYRKDPKDYSFEVIILLHCFQLSSTTTFRIE